MMLHKVFHKVLCKMLHKMPSARDKLAELLSIESCEASYRVSFIRILRSILHRIFFLRMFFSEIDIRNKPNLKRVVVFNFHSV